jgi:hypothetical protein
VRPPHFNAAGGRQVNDDDIVKLALEAEAFKGDWNDITFTNPDFLRAFGDAYAKAGEKPWCDKSRMERLESLLRSAREEIPVVSGETAALCGAIDALIAAGDTDAKAGGDGERAEGAGRRSNCRLHWRSKCRDFVG